MPLRLKVKQERYGRRTIGITRSILNLCVATHRFCRTNRLAWPSWQDLYKAFNACKREDYPFVTEVASRVQEGAFMDFGTAVKNWRDPNHPAGPPWFRKKNRTGTGSFRAASGVVQLRYDGKRRIRLPVVGSVKRAHMLPVGILYEAHISRRNGRWVLSVKYWSEPAERPELDTRIAVGSVDTGSSTMATDSEGRVWESPKAYYRAERKLRRWQRTQARRTPGSHGWWQAQRRINRLQRRTTGLRRNAHHQLRGTGRQVPEHSYRRPERERHDGRSDTEGTGRCRDWRDQAAASLQGPVASLQGAACRPVLSVEQDLLCLWVRKRETQA